MRRLCLLAFAFAAAPAAAQSYTPNDDYDIYSLYVPASRDARIKDVLATLDRLCASDRRADQRRCADAWRIIGEGAAKLQAIRASKE